MRLDDIFAVQHSATVIIVQQPLNRIANYCEILNNFFITYFSCFFFYSVCFANTHSAFSPRENVDGIDGSNRSINRNIKQKRLSEWIERELKWLVTLCVFVWANRQHLHITQSERGRSILDRLCAQHKNYIYSRHPVLLLEYFLFFSRALVSHSHHHHLCSCDNKEHGNRAQFIAEGDTSSTSILIQNRNKIRIKW